MNSEWVAKKLKQNLTSLARRNYLTFLFRKIRVSASSGFSLFLLDVMTAPAVENSLSLGVDVAVMHIYCLASVDK